MLTHLHSFKEICLLSNQKNMSVRTELVYEGELAPFVEADGFFDAILRFKNLLGI